MNYNVNMKIYVGSQVHQFSCYLHLRIKKVLDFNARSVILLKEIMELEAGYVVIGDFQRFRGYTVFICKECQPEIHLLAPEFRKKFLEEMSVVGEAVYKAFKPDKLNYELLGVDNAVHMHWHFFPRREGDTPVKGPVWKLEKYEMYAERYRPADEELEDLKAVLLKEIDKLI